MVDTEPLGPDAADGVDPGRPDGGPGPTPQPDASTPSTPDAAVPVSNPDASPPGPSCTGAPVDVGPPASFAMDTATYFSGAHVFVVRDAGGLYALSSICTHETVTLNQSGSQFRCPRHGATYTRNGDVVSGPVFRPLVHYSLCVLPSGHVGVNTAVTIDSSSRLPV